MTCATVRIPHGVVLIIEVADQDPGVPGELRSRLFERDVRGAGSSGQGHGLYLVDRIVAAHGGTLSLARSDERGSVFRIELPPA